MRLTIRILGLELLHVTTDAEAATDEGGESTTYPLGFTVSPGDQRWEFVKVDPGVE